MEYQVLVEGPVTSEIISKYLNNLGTRTDTGGHSIFIGQVRDDIIKNKKVKAIEYSAYKEMVEVAAENIRKTIFADFSDVKNLFLVHSIGIVRAGEISLFVIVTAGHRDHAIKACHQAVEMIKKDYPVWKKEIFEDDSTLWK